MKITDDEMNDDLLGTLGLAEAFELEWDMWESHRSPFTWFDSVPRPEMALNVLQNLQKWFMDPWKRSILLSIYEEIRISKNGCAWEEVIFAKIYRDT